MTRRPNIVVIHWHDTGRHLGAYGRTHISSPNIDGLAEQGVTFTRAFATAPLCSPSRGSLWTGRYPHSNGLMGLAHLGWEYNANEQTLPMLLAEAGYRGVLVGLQHESADPTTLGYDRIVGLNADRQLAPAVAELAVDELAELSRAGHPFLMVVGMFEPHRPFPEHRFPRSDAPVDLPGYLEPSDDALDDLRGFAAAISYADEATGRVLTALDDLGLAENTMVVFTTDHGIPFPGAKSTLHDAGIEVALIVRTPEWTSRPRGRRADQLVSHVDLVPTVLELVGLDIPQHIQGCSFASELADGLEGARRSEVFAEKNWHGVHQYDPTRAVRTDRYKYIVSYADVPRIPLPSDIAAGGAAIGVDADEPRARVELYDLQADPDETQNLAGRPELAAVEEGLRRCLEQWQEDTDEPLRRGPIRAARVGKTPNRALRGRTVRVPNTFVQRD